MRLLLFFCKRFLFNLKLFHSYVLNFWIFENDSAFQTNLIRTRHQHLQSIEKKNKVPLKASDMVTNNHPTKKIQNLLTLSIEFEIELPHKGFFHFWVVLDIVSRNIISSKWARSEWNCTQSVTKPDRKHAFITKYAAAKKVEYKKVQSQPKNVSSVQNKLMEIDKIWVFMILIRFSLSKNYLKPYESAKCPNLEFFYFKAQ